MKQRISQLLLLSMFCIVFPQAGTCQNEKALSGDSPQRRRPQQPYMHEIKISPAAAPSPELKYKLYPSVNELRPGNSAPLWYRTLRAFEKNKTIGELYNKMEEVPLDQFPQDEVRKLVKEYASLIDTAHQAAYRRSVEWGLQLTELRGRDTIWVRLDEFQQSREIARILLLKSRLHIAEGNFDAALAEMKVTLRLARDVAEPETFINDLIGIAIHAMTMANVEVFIQQPEAPNLYWALAQLPQPFIDIREALEFEITLPERYFPWMVAPDAEQRSPEEWETLMRETIKEAAISLDAFPDKSIIEESPQSEFDELYAEYVSRHEDHARELLLKNGWDKQTVQDMPTGRVLAWREHILYKTHTSRLAANVLLPFVESQARYSQIKLDIADAEQQSLVGLLLPAMQQVYVAQQRRLATRNTLMTIEAIRMHLANSQGHLPETLQQVKVVPIPDFPFTGKPYAYNLSAGNATIDVPIPTWHNRYEISVR